jgi:hypothetical protein
MYRIYVSATFTIISADDSDANYGLRGFKGITLPRSLVQKPIPLAGGEYMLQNFVAFIVEDRPARQIYYNRR